MKINIIGAAILDVLATPVPNNIFDLGTAPVNDMLFTLGGDAANEAVVLSALGKSVELITVIGQDSIGDIISQKLREHHVFFRPECITPEIKSGVNIVLVQDSGERSFLTDPHGSLRTLDPSHIPMPFAPDTEILCLASIFVSPLLDIPSLERIFKQAKSQHITVCADMTKCKNNETLDDMKPVFQYVDYIFPNASEALHLSRCSSVEAAAEAFCHAGVKNAIIKSGNKGAFLKNSTFHEWIPAEENVKCIDTTGAGDSFSAGFLAALSEGRPLRDCVCFANTCGARSVRMPGATTWVREL